MQAERPLRDLFNDMHYAWQLLENEVRLETSDAITGEDVSYLLQLYMRGVQKMNSLVDIRQSFFKNKVTSLMSRQAVIRILNKPMNKKNKPQEVEASPPNRKADNKKELQLQQKRKQIQMRLAYGAQEHSPEVLKKLVAEHNQKQSIISSRIQKIIDTHQEKLANRIRQRKLRTVTAKSRSDIFMQEGAQFNGASKIQLLQKKRDEEQFGSFPIIQEKIEKNNRWRDGRKEKRPWKSLQTKNIQKEELQSPSKGRRISVDFKALQKNNQKF